MRGLMMDFPLTLVHVLERAGKLFGDVEIVSRRPDRRLSRCTYRDVYLRSRKLARALQLAGMKPGDRVATLLWSHSTNLECYFGIPVAGGVMHTLNLRLHPDELAYIANHGQDRFLIVDDILLPTYESFRAKVPFERVLCVPFACPNVPEGMEDYEKFLEEIDGEFAYPEFDENQAASICFTSGTTGKPKGVVYSHRAQVLHSLAACLSDSFGVSNSDTILPASSMFHANGWGVPYAAALMGAKIVFPGPHLDPESLLELIQKENVTLATGVPTVWYGLLGALEKNPSRWNPSKQLRIMCGGSAVPESLLRGLDRFGIRLVHLWGMTETAPIATLGVMKSTMSNLSEEQKYEKRAKQGFAVPFIELRAMTSEGEAPWDGVTFGELEVRGPWVASSYLEAPESRDRWTADGWFRTGDIVTIDPEGYIKIVDRGKDLIKSGGEWISSVDLENALMCHPSVREAAVIGLPHPKWQERPLAVVVAKDGMHPQPDELRAFLAERFAKWQLPDAFVFAGEIPRTSVGKFLKLKMREQYTGWKWDE